jgi:hypothetical protein
VVCTVGNVSDVVVEEVVVRGGEVAEGEKVVAGEVVLEVEEVVLKVEVVLEVEEVVLRVEEMVLEVENIAEEDVEVLELLEVAPQLPTIEGTAPGPLPIGTRFVPQSAAFAIWTL